MLYWKMSLNPCFNGRYSQSLLPPRVGSKIKYVLILVLMEDTLRGMLRALTSLKKSVLILVLMEDTLRGKKLIVIIYHSLS